MTTPTTVPDRGTNLPACRFLGNPTGDELPCPTCQPAPDGKPKVRVPVMACAKLGRCTRGLKASEDVMCCRECPYYATGAAPSPGELLTLALPAPDGPDRMQPVSAASVAELLPGLPDPLPDPPMRPVADGWACRSSVRERHVHALNELADMTFPGPDRAEGDGVLVCGGGRYWPGMVVAIRMLREVSTLPVQVWYRGGAERVNPDDLADVDGVTFHDATKLPHRLLGGWEIKTLALLNCGLRRVVYLDADAYVVADPARLLDLATEFRFVFWHDMDSQKESLGWQWFGMDAQAGSRIPPVQGGQLAIDLVAFRRELVLAHWLNQHSDYSYHHPKDAKRKHEWHLYGDQDAYRAALALTGGEHLCLGPAAWIKPAFVCAYDGKPLVVHRCQGKLLWEAKDDRTAHLPGDDRAFAHLDAYLKGDGKPATVFGRIYERGAWGHGDRSGAGSTPKEAAPYIETANTLIRAAGWGSVVDLGCGDGYVTSRIECGHVAGVDVYSPHLERLRRQPRPGREWLALDMDRDREKLPRADAIFLKDVLQHVPNTLVLDWLTWAGSSGRWRFIVITNDQHEAKDGADCALGGYRSLRHDLKPLSLVPGLRKLCEYGGGQKAVLLLECP